MISQTTEYALRAMVLFHSERGKAWTTAELASQARVPGDYLAKVLQRLGRAGLIAGSRGAKGGYRLAKRRKKITILEVVRAVDPLPRIHRCPLGLRSHGAKLCPLHRRLDEAAALVEASFGGATLDELTEKPTTAGRRPCRFPAKAATAVIAAAAAAKRP
jgi:Rrf2 family protein